MRKAFIFTITIVMICGILALAVISCSSAGKAKTAVFDIKSRTVRLNNGIKMPLHGLGTFQLTPEQAENSVYHALMYGHRLIDAANAYMNERAVGRGIQRSGVPREDIFITTKLWPSDYENVERAIDDTLARLKVEYIDLLLLHQPFGNYLEGYRGMEAAVRQGKVRSIGLSNFYESRFDEIMNIATIPPAVLQIEINPYVQQDEMREYVKPYGTVLMAWYPLGGRVNERNDTQTRLFGEKIITGLAEKYGKSPAQIILRWHLQKGNIAVPGADRSDYILENVSIFDFELTAKEMRRLGTLDMGTPFHDLRNLDGDTRAISWTRPIDFNAQK